VVCDGLKGLPDSITNLLAVGDRPGLRDSSAAQHIPVRQPQVLGRHGQGPATGLYRRQRSLSAGPVPGVRRPVGTAIPGDHPHVALRLDRVRGCSWTTTSKSDASSPATNAIESLNARYRRAFRARGHFPTQAALKCLYLATRSLDPTVSVLTLDGVVPSHYLAQPVSRTRPSRRFDLRRRVSEARPPCTRVRALRQIA